MKVGRLVSDLGCHMEQIPVKVRVKMGCVEKLMDVVGSRYEVCEDSVVLSLGVLGEKKEKRCYKAVDVRDKLREIDIADDVRREKDRLRKEKAGKEREQKKRKKIKAGLEKKMVNLMEELKGNGEEVI